jgi:hypothetical protein
VTGRVERWLRDSRLTSDQHVDDRVRELLEAVRIGSQREDGESWDAANERKAEEFVAWLERAFPGRVFTDGAALPDGEAPVVAVDRQRLRPLARRTTGYNYAFTVPGRSRERLVLVAHYDTWRGPGADDNTTGEEIVKQYLVEALRAPSRPPLTHTYLLAGSEECGLIGFTSQLVLGVGLALANVAWAHGVYAVAGLGMLLVPLATFRFGVSGSREYVRGLADGERDLIQAAISVDSVGEGRLYIPDSSLGATFARAFLPLDGHERLNDMLQEAAHLHGIKYNTYLAGGTTDHISFLEAGRPGAALVALLPGKASPLVFGGKIHTRHDTPDRVYPEPLAHTLRILDTFFHLAQGGARLPEPRELDEFHYARLYHVGEELWLALKDAIEPNRRNVNVVYRVQAAIEAAQARCRVVDVVGWGVETQLGREVSDLAGERATPGRVRVRAIELHAPGGVLAFAQPPHRWRRGVAAAAYRAMGALESLIGTHSFLVFFAAAFLIARGVEWALAGAFRWAPFQELFFAWFWLTMPATLVAQIALVVWLVGTRLPAMADDSYKHLSRADNLLSLRRVGGHRDDGAAGAELASTRLPSPGDKA